MKLNSKSAVVLALATISVGAIAQTTSATGFITLLSQTGNVYNYDISITNTGTSGIGTLWYAWNPGQDYLPTMPTSVGTPAGWTLDGITHGDSGDGYGIHWGGGTLASGATLDGFLFSSTDSPAVLGGFTTVPDYNGQQQPVGDTFVYAGDAFVSASYDLVINPVPAPSGFFGLLPFAGIAILAARRRR